MSNAAKHAKRSHSLKSAIILSTALALSLSACNEGEEIQPGPRYSLDGQIVSGGTVAGTAQALSIEPRSTRDWPQHLSNAQHQSSNAALSTSPQLVATVNLGIQSRKPVYGAAKPIIKGDVIYHYDADGVLHAIKASGQELWRSSLIPPGGVVGDGFGGGLAYDNGRIYAATGYGEVVAVDAATGGVIWRYKQSTPLRTAPLVTNGKVYIISQGVTAVALNAANGSQIWRQYSAQSIITQRLSSGVPASQGGDVIFGYASGEIQRVDSQSGRVVWRVQNISDNFTGSKSSVADITGDPVIINGKVIAATNSGVIAIDYASGQVLWANNIGSKGPLIVSGNSVFGVTENARVYRLSADSGKTVWAKAMPRVANEKLWLSPKFFYFDPRLVNNQIWVADQRGNMRRYDAGSGALVGVDTTAELASTPVAGSGVMVSVNPAGQMLIFR